MELFDDVIIQSKKRFDSILKFNQIKTEWFHYLIQLFLSYSIELKHSIQSQLNDVIIQSKMV